MPPARKRENRENQFYNVGEQGRKTGIRLEDKGVRDEYGMEPVSGIFSSPEKSPPKRGASARRTGGTVTDSESMDIQESTIPDLTPGHILRNSRTNLPPPRSRSPMKTALGSSPRRQSMAPQAQSLNRSSSSNRVSSRPGVSRRLDFDQEDTSLQETPALSGSGARRGGKTRRDIYDIEPSPVPTYTAMLDESLVQEEISANEDSNMFNGIGGDSFAGLEDTTAAAYDMDGSMDAAEPYVEEFVPKPAKRGRKRKSDTLDEVVERDSPAPLPKKGRTTTTKASATVKGKKTVQPAKSKPGRAAKPKRFSEIIEDDSSVAEANPTDESIQEEEEPIKAPAKGRGRPPKASVDTSIDESVQDPPVRGRGRPSKKTVSKDSPGKENRDSSVFKKPAPKSKAKPKPSPLSNTEPVGTGRLVDAAGKPLSKDQIDQMSTASTGSRFGRGRQLSVFREFGAEQFGRVGRTGRHHLPPVNFWAGEQVNYDKDGSLVAVYQPEAWDEPPKKKAGAGKKKGGKRGRAADDDDEDDTLEEWETKDGVFGGIYRDFDAATETMLDDHLEGPIAWSEKGIKPNPVASQQFKFCKLSTAGDTGFFSWGAIELEKDGIKRAKNSRKMQMVFNVMKGAVEVNVNDNVFTVHKGGIWQVPRGNLYSIRNVAKSDSRIFFAQAFESTVQAED